MQQEVRQPVALTRLHQRGWGIERCWGPSASTWPPRCICSLSSSQCWWAHTSSSLPGSEELTGGPVLTPGQRQTRGLIKACSHWNTINRTCSAGYVIKLPSLDWKSSVFGIKATLKIPNPRLPDTWACPHCSMLLVVSALPPSLNAISGLAYSPRSPCCQPWLAWWCRWWRNRSEKPDQNTDVSQNCGDFLLKWLETAIRLQRRAGTKRLFNQKTVFWEESVTLSHIVSETQQWSWSGWWSLDHTDGTGAENEVKTIFKLLF